MDLNEEFEGFSEGAGNAHIMADFASKFLASAVYVHMMHLSSSSYSEHMALGEYYEAIHGLVDSVIETYQGKYGKIPYVEYNSEPMAETGAIEYLDNLKGVLARYRTQMPQDSEIQNEIDNVSNQINSTLYKLRFLK
jgi:hypothetical protein